MATNLTTLRDAQRHAAQAQAERDAVAATLGTRSAEITRLQAQLAAQTRAGHRAGAATNQEQLTAATAARAVDLVRLRAADVRLREISDLIKLTDPCDADPAVPLLLLPVRVETRFTTDKASLRVRVYPDDVHIDQL